MLDNEPSAAAATRHELVGVAWREYDFDGRVYRVERPVAFWHRPGGETHRVEDAAGVVHIVPAPGHHGCVLRYVKDPGEPPVRF